MSKKGGYIDIDIFSRFKKNFFLLSNMKEDDIILIWKENGSKVKAEDIKEYRFDAPLYEKMVWRKRNSKRIFHFFGGLDPNNRRMAFLYCGIHDCEGIVNFFLWYINTYSAEIGEECEIMHFMNLKFEKKEEIINIYNSKELNYFI